MFNLTRPYRSAAIALLALAVPMALSEARAQPADPAPPDQQTVPPKTPDQTTPGTMRKDTPEPLAKTLDQSNGVIKPPPHIDPGMQKPTPDMGPQSTPVIPPPGALGNDSNVQPK
jgi:hypothetical protein